ncbi:hypothetical protein H310_06932 [Aphanomyces invadans]|uniref:Uncharacterized protein n=1 Tax=Aphanomyces invadans TaxID=157072 RepID=A0A024U723_9STRA|nr:hypothetical protein H310_06932 [Aphanomyces invadans]ETW01383.1 hypothetical protein H310_06932 [Aphanomyces invadans]|eukprot:XP_008870381.1 hypothetical protein H310_06932 [Aphanomyces invadans]
MTDGAVAAWCREVCVSSTTSSLCNRSIEICPPCVRRTALDILMCSPGNCSAAAVCPPTIQPTTSPRPTTTPNTTNVSTAVATTFPTTLLVTAAVPQPPDRVAPISSSSTILPMPTLVLVLTVAGSFLVCLTGFAWMYRRRRAAKQDLDVNLTIVHRRQHAKAYNPALANCKLDEFDMHSYNHPRSTSRTQSMSKSSWPYSDMHWSSLCPSTNDKPTDGGDGFDPDPWVFTSPYRRSSVIELGGDVFIKHDDGATVGCAADSPAHDTRSSCSGSDEARGSSPTNTVILGRR